MKGKPYKFIWGNTQFLITVQMNLDSPLRFPKIPWNNINRILEISRNNKISTYHGSEDLERDIEEGKRYFDKQFRQKFITDIEKAVQRHKLLFEELGKLDYQKLLPEQLFAYCKKAIDQWTELISYFRGHQDEASHLFIEEIKKYVPADKLSELLLPVELDPINKEQIDWQNLLKKSLDKQQLWSHVKKYPWLAANHFSYVQVEQTLIERFKFDQEHRQDIDLIKEKASLRQRQNEMLEKLPEETKELVSFAHVLALTRMILKSYWAGTDYYLIPLFEEIASRNNETATNICKYYLIEDIQNLSRGIKLDNKEKEKRKYCFVGLLKGGKQIFKSGPEAEALAKAELGELFETKKVSELIGRSANKGVIRGIVRILEANNTEQARNLRTNFKKGEILVTEMTQPAIVDIAQKAGAIVTDEGGMLSHAAIISREFGIPCVVGTHKATHVLKDGDFIEVDANNGVVRILEKK